jgi:hypothetical protein
MATPTSKKEKIRLSLKLPTTLDRLGEIGEEDIDMADTVGAFTSYINVKAPSNDLSSKEIDKLFKLYASSSAKVSWKETDRFWDIVKNNDELLRELIIILRGEELAQNQNVRLLATYIVDAPTSGKKLENYFDSTAALASFSMGRGYSEKYTEEPYTVQGRKVLRYQKFKDREVQFRKAEDIFLAIFGQKPDNQDIKDAASYLGLLRSIKKYLQNDAITRVFDRMVWHFYESDNRMSRHDIEDDRKPKEMIMSAFVSNLGSAINKSEKLKNLESIKKAFYDEYEKMLQAEVQ